jgi:NAD(P)-dependent dehydrogenase (short-subunit alcohol dehydrogenase family)
MKKTILITGSTDGIGKLTAIKLAKAGHEVIVHGRTSSKVEKTVKEIISTSNNKAVTGFSGDLSDFSSMKEMLELIKQKVKKLDILINNAGVYRTAETFNTVGLDLRFMVNHYAVYLLTRELLPLLRKGSNPRIISLSSAAQATFNTDVLIGKDKKSANETYAQSKLALTMWSFNLAKQEKDMVIIAVNPGSLLNTKMVQEAYGHSWSSADKGANILFELALDDKHASKSGLYFDNAQASYGDAHPDAYDEKKIKQLIKNTEEVVSRHF